MQSKYKWKTNRRRKFK